MLQATTILYMCRLEISAPPTWVSHLCLACMRVGTGEDLVSRPLGSMWLLSSVMFEVNYSDPEGARTV